MSEIDRELTTLESERKMSALALKAHQKQMADKLRGEMGKDINKNVSMSFWKRVVRGFDNFLKNF